MGSSAEVRTQAQAAAPATERVNDFTIQVATVNGTGSQSSNNVLMRAIFQMGVPVSGKNMFPSNIKGLPTWFAVRLSKDGYVARRKELDVSVCMNPKTARKDLAWLEPGGLCVYDAPLALEGVRSDVRYLGVPFAKLMERIPNADNRLRTLLVNMAYVGVLAELLRIEEAEIERALGKQFKSKPKAVSLNMQAVKLGAEYARGHFQGACGYRVERMQATAGKIIVDGNTAAAIGALLGGCGVLAWYPITPSSSLCEALIDLAGKYRVEPESGLKTFAAVQAEDELASIGMVLGAAWAGARAMTATSGPGISLMSEWAGYAYYAEIPAVIVDVQRAGPSTGLPTRTQQADLLQVYYLSHGDTKQLCVIPGTVQECCELTAAAFDFAERFQAPVFVLSDLDLGMNNWMSDPFPYPERPLDRGKVLTEERLRELAKQGKPYYRYEDADADGIPYRTLPGNAHPDAAFLTRGSGHDWKGQYTEDPAEYRHNLDRIARKYETARAALPAPVLEGDLEAEVGLLAFGSTHAAVLEARDRLDAAGVPTAYLRLRALPPHAEVEAFVRRRRVVYLIEQNRDAQMKTILKSELPPELAPRLKSILHYGGMPIDARTVVEAVRAGEGGS
ncbi:MAG: 2-oxoacid:acceptor oxidoreductase subunit alpha [Planctomycetota bacterium]|nr:2-oxoacid:acceptor oxidoreductase subunit alpha [Planctomycetota bacterium]